MRELTPEEIARHKNRELWEKTALAALPVVLERGAVLFPDHSVKVAGGIADQFLKEWSARFD